MNAKQADRRVRWTACTLGAAAMLAGLGPAAPARAAGCPNEAIRASQTSAQLPKGTVGLPACMALEMVSPSKKLLQPAFGPAYFSATGERVLFKSTAALADTTGLQSAVDGDYYVASRGGSGWTTSQTSAPSEAAIFTGSNYGGPYAFSSDLGRWLLYGSTEAQYQVAALRFFQLGLDGSSVPLSSLLVPNDDSGGRLNARVLEYSWRATSRDLSTTLFSAISASPNTSTTFLPDDPGEDTSGGGSLGDERNQYIVSRDPEGNTSLELLARDEEGVVHGGFCGTNVGGGIGGNQFAVISGRLDQGAISAGGSRIYFTTRPAQAGKVEGSWVTCDTANPRRIMVRNRTPEGPEISELIAGGPASGSDLYQAASADGSKVYFTTTRPLLPSDTDSGPSCSAKAGQSDGCDLYLYDEELPEGERLIQVSEGEAGTPTPGEGAEVLSSITAASNDGTHAYFVAEGILSNDPNPEGDSATQGEPNLYLYQRNSAHPSGDLAFIGTLSPSDEEELWGVERSFTGGAYAVPLWTDATDSTGGDGHLLLFASKASLSGEDTDAGHRDVYRYDSEAGSLLCLSCPAGADGPFDVSVNPYLGQRPAPNFTEPGRWVSEDADTVAFATTEPLVEGDIDGASNPYLWSEGELARLPATVKEGGVELPTVSAPGNAVSFSTPNALLAVDGDTTRDVYVLRAGGGFPNPQPPSVCDPLLEGACQGPPTTAPAVPAAASSSFSGPGNQRSAPGCTKPRVRRKGRCVKPRKRAAKRRASRDKQGGRR